MISFDLGAMVSGHKNLLKRKEFIWEWDNAQMQRMGYSDA
jgi:hypothetical protein